MMRSRVLLPDGTPGELASLRWANGVVAAVRVNVGRHLTGWLDPRTVMTRPTQPAA